jgi:hydroxymethylpyrimidine/phosphomethylpyrimidine kinase
MSAVTALTAQHTRGVDGVWSVPPSFVVAQIEAVAGDIGVDAAKTGMLGDEELIDAVAGALGRLGAPVVVDPVMVATSGARLLEPGAERAVAERLLPVATVATPNVAEARALAGADDLQGADLARAVRALGAEAVVVTGGDAGALDWLADDEGVVPIGGAHHRSAAAHGSGCTHSAALAVFLARGLGVREAARQAHAVAAMAVRDGLDEIGAGPGPVDLLVRRAPVLRERS